MLTRKGLPLATILTAAFAMSCGAASTRLSAQPTSSVRPDQAALSAMTQAERAFAELSVRRGMKEAFLTWMSDSGVIFRPTAIHAKQAWSARESPAATLNWEPEYGEMAYSGDLGLSTGPWKMTFPPDRRQPALYGRFFSMWRRQPDGSWKVDADIGVSHEQPYRSVGATTFRAGPVHPAPGPLKQRLDLAELDRAIGRGSGRGSGHWYRRNVTEDFRLLREGYFLYDRSPDALAALDSLAGRFEFIHQGGGVSNAMDFAYTYGIAPRVPEGATTPADTTVYFHVWRRLPQGWRVSYAVLNPVR